jgi:hypothetical protein
MSDGDRPFHPEIAEGAKYGSWGQKIIRVHRSGPEDKANKPSWFVGPMKNRNQAAITERGRWVFFELEDDGLSEKERNLRGAEDIIRRLNADDATADLIRNSFGVLPDESPPID